MDTFSEDYPIVRKVNMILGFIQDTLNMIGKLIQIKLTTNYRLEKNTIDYSGQSKGMDYYYNTIDLPNVKHSNSFFMNGYRASIISRKPNL